MATDVKKPRKPRGPIIRKDKTAYMVYEGDVTNFSILFDPEKVMEAMDANPNLKRKKFVVPVKSKPKVPVDSATAA